MEKKPYPAGPAVEAAKRRAQEEHIKRCKKELRREERKRWKTERR